MSDGDSSSVVRSEETTSEVTAIMRMISDEVVVQNDVGSNKNKVDKLIDETLAEEELQQEGRLDEKREELVVIMLL
jgi:hypothetical protein